MKLQDRVYVLVSVGDGSGLEGWTTGCLYSIKYFYNVRLGGYCVVVVVCHFYSG